VEEISLLRELPDQDFDISTSALRHLVTDQLGSRTLFGIEVRAELADLVPYVRTMAGPVSVEPRVVPGGHRAPMPTISGAWGSVYVAARIARQVRAARGAGWQRGQENDDRFMKCSRRIGAPHLGHGIPSWPYAASDRSK